MQAPVCDSMFDVVFWFMDRALNDKEYLQSGKMHRLLYLAQAYYAVLRRKKLVPAVFVAADEGPLEPNLYRLFAAAQRPYIERLMVPEEGEAFLDSLWRRFGHHSGDYLSRLLKSHAPYAEARAQGGMRAEIGLDAMVRFYGRPRQPDESSDAGRVDARQMIKPRMMRTQTGRPVAVQAWAPVKPKVTPTVVIRAVSPRCLLPLPPGPRRPPCPGLLPFPIVSGQHPRCVP